MKITQIETFQVTDRTNAFTIALDSEPLSVSFDPNVWVLTSDVTFDRR